MLGFLVFVGVIAATIGFILYGFGVGRGGVSANRDSGIGSDGNGFSAILLTGGEVMTDPDRGVIGPSDEDVAAANAAGGDDW